MTASQWRVQAKREKAEAAGKGRGEKRAKDFMEREFGGAEKGRDADLAAANEVCTSNDLVSC